MADLRHQISGHAIGSRCVAVLLAVAEAGSIRRAAAALGITPAAISKMVRQAEARLGGPVFARSAAGVEPTPVGRRFLDAGRDALGQLAAAQEAFERECGGPGGRLRIGTGPFAAGAVAARLIPQARLRWPDLQISMTLGSADALLRGLCQGVHDIAICHLEDLSVPQGCTAHRIQTLRSVVLARPQNPLAGRACVAWPDIAPYALAGFEQPYSRFLRWYREQVGVDPRIAFMGPDFDLLAQSVLESDVLLITAAGIGARLCASHGLVELRMAGPRFDHDVFCVLADGARTPAVTAIAALIDETISFDEQ
ncbi:LysR family transcriptional regulator [Polymorphobacter fuscus]|nr:LysR family transcriptional regulator [Polymorphobacter fuscus]NJC08168.1 DNA-binding transcriptional LysR family regulator [Polymorphobacter fuscus]